MKNTLAQQWLEGRPFHHIGSAMKNVTNAQRHAGVRKHANGPALIYVDKHINIAVGSGLAASNRPKNGRM